MLKKQQKVFVQGYNPEVHDVIKYTKNIMQHRATLIISAGQYQNLDDSTVLI